VIFFRVIVLASGDHYWCLLGSSSGLFVWALVCLKVLRCDPKDEH